MFNFGNKLVYLDVQKTGSSYVREFLKACCTLPLKRHDHHGRIRNDYQPEAYHFISVRHPLSLYVSLFRYGLNGKGELRHRLARMGHAGLYQSDEAAFERWMAFMLDVENAPLLGEGFKDTASLGIGFQTFRFLALSFVQPLKRLQTVSDYSGVVNLYEKNNIADKVIRNEALTEGLRELALHQFPQYFDLTKTNAFLGGGGRRNASLNRPGDGPGLSPALRKEFEQKERFLLDRFYS